MKVFLVGTSWTLSLVLPPEHRFPTVLGALLEERFPGKQVEVQTDAWVNFSPPRRVLLLNRIKEEQPDYLILAPTGVWVTFPLIVPALMQHVPKVARTPVYSMVRKLQGVDRQFSDKGWAWHMYLYPVVDWIGRMLRARPLYTIPEALAALEEFIVTVKRQESTEILMTPRNAFPTSHEPSVTDPHLDRMLRNPSFMRTVPPDSIPQWNLFGEGVFDLCRKHRIPSVDIWSGLVVDASKDGSHPGIETTRLQASRVSDAIVEMEGAYRG